MGDRTTRPHTPLRACRIRRYVVALAVLAWLAGAPVLAQTGLAQVDRVIDGDTISVRPPARDAGARLGRRACVCIEPAALSVGLMSSPHLVTRRVQFSLSLRQQLLRPRFRGLDAPFHETQSFNWSSAPKECRLLFRRGQQVPWPLGLQLQPTTLPTDENHLESGASLEPVQYWSGTSSESPYGPSTSPDWHIDRSRVSLRAVRAWWS